MARSESVHTETQQAPVSGWPTAAAVRRSPTRAQRYVVFAGLGTLLLAVCVASLGLGPVPISFGDTLTILVRALSGDAATLPNALVVTEIRLPRMLLALLAGAGLGVAGAAMQAYFRNPLAEPGVTGVASGAAVGAVTVIVFGISALGPWTLPVAAFLGAVIVLVTVQFVALASRDRGVTTVLLVGIALNAFCGGVIGALIANAQDTQTARGAIFWLQGDLTAAKWADLTLITAPVLIGIALIWGFARELNLLLLGDETAQSIGLRVTRTRTLVLVLTSLVIGAVISVTGVIGFVGLVAPHIVRLLIGADHRALIPASMLLGGIFLVAADTVARLGPLGGSWQTGVVTALIGSPVFLALVLRSRTTSRRGI